MHFRDFLRHELVRRKGLNPQYSLRAFARQLKTDPSTFSQILSGKRKIGSASIRKLGERMKLDEREIAGWVSNHTQKVIETKERALQEDHYKLIADWYHYAIFELMMTRGFKSEPSWIAKKLKIKPSEARIALARLVRLGIAEEKDGNFSRTTHYLTTHHLPFSGSAFRSAQDQFLNMAKNSLIHTPYEKREQVSLTIAARPEDIELIRKKIRKFHKQLNDWIEARGEATEVYHLVTAYYPVSEEEKS
jgi:uncharacterized protein (TIGR02147 family)